MPIVKPRLDPKQFKNLPRGVEVITQDKEKEVRRAFEEATVYVWKTLSPIAPRMYQNFRIAIKEKYFSTVGQIFTQTPFWRGELFTRGITRHEMSHWSIYPIDVFRSLKDLTTARELLMKELGISKKDKDWGKKFPYSLGELTYYQNMIGDYLVNLHIALRYPKEWRVLWQFLKQGGKEKRDSAFKVYISVYPKILRILTKKKYSSIKLNPQAEVDSDKIKSLIQKVRTGKIGKAFAIKELAKILHKYYEEDQKQCKDSDGEGSSNCPKCGKNDWTIIEVTEKDKNGNPRKIKIKCKKCGYETEVEVDPSSCNPLKPRSKAHGLKAKWSKTELDKILEHSNGASLEDLGEIGIDLTEKEYLEALQRAKVRKFIREHVVVAKELKKRGGEKFRVSTDVWQFGDPLTEINIPSTELASLGIEDLRMIPSLTLRKNVYVTTRGHEEEALRGVVYIAFLDVSGSMAGPPEKKALAMLQEVYEICKKLDFEFKLCLFSTRARRIPQEDLERFFKDSSFRNSCASLGGGTVLSSGLKLFDMNEYKEANICIISDCDLGDVLDTKEKMLEIARVTKSFKIILIRDSYRLSDEEIARLQEEWFPNNEVKVLGISVTGDEKLV